jgi:hypothetical protein
MKDRVGCAFIWNGLRVPRVPLGNVIVAGINFEGMFG